MIRLLALLFLLPACLPAQYVAEVFANDKNIAHEIWLGDTLALDGKLSFFNYTRLRVSHEDNALNEVLIFSTITYNLSPTWGLVGGGYYSFGRFFPVAGVSYILATEDLFLYANPYLVFARDLEFELFFLGQYRPRLSERFSGFAQLVVNPNTGPKGFNFSEQNLRLGLDRNGWQFGVGLDLLALTVENAALERTTELATSLGVFVRREF